MNFREYLKNNKVYLDGGFGTLVQAAGLPAGEYPERWNVSHPEVVTKIHKDYFDAGSNVVNANTFGANCLKFEDAELEEIIDDYMLSFYNYYGIDKESEPERYEAVLNNNLLVILYHVTGVNTYEELLQVDLESAVTKYLLDAGMEENDILTLKEKLR